MCPHKMQLCVVDTDMQYSQNVVQRQVFCGLLQFVVCFWFYALCPSPLILAWWVEICKQQQPSFLLLCHFKCLVYFCRAVFSVDYQGNVGVHKALNMLLLLSKSHVQLLGLFWYVSIWYVIKLVCLDYGCSVSIHLFWCVCPQLTVVCYVILDIVFFCFVLLFSIN